MLQISDDGTELYSDPLELSDDLIFTLADIDGGRGGETSPNEGEDQSPGDISGEDIGSDAPEECADIGQETEPIILRTALKRKKSSEQ